MSIRGFRRGRQRVERVSIGMIAPLRVAARSKSGTTTKKLGKEKNAIRQDNRVANGSEGRRIYFISELYRVDCHGPTEWMLCPARTRSFRPHTIPPPPSPPPPPPPQSLNHQGCQSPDTPWLSLLFSGDPSHPIRGDVRLDV